MYELFQAGGPLMWPLLICSVVAFAIVLERFWFWHKMKPEQDVANADLILAQLAKDRNSIPQLEHPGCICRVLTAGMCCGSESAEKAMSIIAMRSVAKMRRGMNVLDTVITVAPMLGIIGTVTGIIASFESLAIAGVGDPKAVIGGIAEALITTATGLVISVGTLFPYNYFNTRIERAQDLIEMYASHLEISLGDSEGECVG
jgi:biopolymer transport protein ExbB